MTEINNNNFISNSDNYSISALKSDSQMSKTGYKGNMTSKEAGNMVKSMIQAQELALLEEYQKSNH